MNNKPDIIDKNWTHFEVEDVFNGNLLEGYISHKNDDSYGALYIEKVNGESVPQLIYCTPKMKYPFDRNMKWILPPVKKIYRYIKIDGSNIFAYQYKNSKGNRFVTYKSRLTPVVRNNRFINLYDYWNEILKEHNHIEKAVLEENMNLSFELWGSKNRILIEYDEDLEVSFLFVRHNNKIFPPHEISVNYDNNNFEFDGALVSNMKTTGLMGVIHNDNKIKNSYEDVQDFHESQLEEIDEGYYKGNEGEVWYCLTETGLWVPIKLKPNTIEQIHWSAGEIGKNAIMTTCINAYEEYDNPTYENIVELLKEEFSEQDILKREDLIKRCMQEIRSEIAFRESVLEEYNKLGVSILNDKKVVMRALSDKFDKKAMGKVYSVIMNEVSS